jgi:hypothetical protein
MNAPLQRSRPPPGTVVVAVEIAVAAVGLLVVVFGPWRLGVGMIGAGLVAGSMARTLLPERAAGLLRVCRPTVDVVIMTGLGIVIVLLAFLVPDQPDRL